MTSQTSKNKDVNETLSAMLNKQLEEAKSGKEDAFVAAMFRASAFLVTSQGTAFTCTTSYFMQECELVIQGPK